MSTRTVLRLTRWSLLASAALAGIAMILYLGGTVLNSTSPGYSFFEDSLSDLGSTVAWSGEANRGSSFHVASSFILVLAGCACILALIRVYSSSLIPRRLARSAGIFALLAGAALLGSALAPQDRYAGLHGRFTLLAVGSFPMATGLLGLATALDNRFRRRASICWFALTTIVVVWTAVTLQKLVAITLVGTLVLQGCEAERVVATDATATFNDGSDR